MSHCFCFNIGAKKIQVIQILRQNIKRDDTFTEWQRQTVNNDISFKKKKMLKVYCVITSLSSTHGSSTDRMKS